MIRSLFAETAVTNLAPRLGRLDDYLYAFCFARIVPLCRCIVPNEVNLR